MCRSAWPLRRMGRERLATWSGTAGDTKPCQRTVRDPREGPPRGCRDSAAPPLCLAIHRGGVSTQNATHKMRWRWRFRHVEDTSRCDSPRQPGAAHSHLICGRMDSTGHVQLHTVAVPRCTMLMDDQATSSAPSCGSRPIGERPELRHWGHTPAASAGTVSTGTRTTCGEASAGYSTGCVEYAWSTKKAKSLNQTGQEVEQREV